MKTKVTKLITMDALEGKRAYSGGIGLIFLGLGNLILLVVSDDKHGLVSLDNALAYICMGMVAIGVRSKQDRQDRTPPRRQPKKRSNRK